MDAEQQLPASPTLDLRLSGMMLEHGNRRIFLTGPGRTDPALELALRHRKFALMLPAFTTFDLSSALVPLVPMTIAGCVEVCCIGPLSALLENSLDSALEDAGHLDVATTSFCDENEGLNYFLFAAGGARDDLDLVAAVAAHGDLQAALTSLLAWQ